MNSIDRFRQLVRRLDEVDDKRILDRKRPRVTTQRDVPRVGRGQKLFNFDRKKPLGETMCPLRIGSATNQTDRVGNEKSPPPGRSSEK